MVVNVISPALAGDPKAGNWRGRVAPESTNVGAAFIRIGAGTAGRAARQARAGLARFGARSGTTPGYARLADELRAARDGRAAAPRGAPLNN